MLPWPKSPGGLDGWAWNEVSHLQTAGLAIAMAKKSASSKSKPDGKRFLALAAVRHDESSPSSVAQEKTPSDVKGQENPGQASGDRLHFPGPAKNQEVTEPWKVTIGCQKENNKMHRRYLNATSPKSQCASGGRPIAVYVERR